HSLIREALTSKNPMERPLKKDRFSLTREAPIGGKGEAEPASPYPSAFSIASMGTNGRSRRSCPEQSLSFEVSNLPHRFIQGLQERMDIVHIRLRVFSRGLFWRSARVTAARSSCPESGILALHYSTPLRPPTPAGPTSAAC